MKEETARLYFMCGKMVLDSTPPRSPMSFATSGDDAG
jgi:hypothetical protein